MVLNIIKKTSTHNTTKKSRKIEYIVIHYTAGVTSKKGSAINTANYFATTKTQASTDFIVDDETIVQYNPDLKNYTTWQCGGSKYNTKGGSFYGKCTNKNSIGIEICSSNKTGKVTNANDNNWYFTDKAINKAIELVKYLMKELNIDINHVIRHYDVTGKPCPGIIGWNKDTGNEDAWKAFKNRLVETTTQKVVTPSTPSTPNKKEDNKTTFKPYTICVTASTLNIRSGAGTNYKIVGTLNKSNTKYTIVEEKNGFGKLKSGAGWICLKYTKKC